MAVTYKINLCKKLPNNICTFSSAPRALSARPAQQQNGVFRRRRLLLRHRTLHHLFLLLSFIYNGSKHRNVTSALPNGTEWRPLGSAGEKRTGISFVYQYNSKCLNR